MYFSRWEASYQISHWLDIFMPTPWQWHRGHCSTESITSNICRVCFFLFPVTLLDLSWEFGDSVVEVTHTKRCIYSFRALGNYRPNWKVKNNPLLNNPTQKFIGALAGPALELLPFTANSVMDTIPSHFQLEKLSTMFITPKKHNGLRINEPLRIHSFGQMSEWVNLHRAYCCASGEQPVRRQAHSSAGPSGLSRLLNSTLRVLEDEDKM